MKIKLLFGPSEKYPAARVRTEDVELEDIAAFLQGDLQLPVDARRFAQTLRDVMTGKVPPFQGSGDAYFRDVGVTETRVGPDLKPDPDTVTVFTADLLTAVEEWAAHLEKSRTWPEWALKGPDGE